MKKLILLTIATLAVTGFLPMTAALADNPSDEAAFVVGINDLRASKGLPPLAVHSNLTSKARAWAQTMADKGTIWHSVLSDGITADWRKLGENVGQGGSVAGLQLAFTNSPLHYANLIDPNFNTIGIGVVRSAGGIIFVAEEFMQLPSSAVAPVAPAAPVMVQVAVKAPAAVAPVAVRAPVAVAPPVVKNAVAGGPVAPRVAAPIRIPVTAPTAAEELVAVKPAQALRQTPSVRAEVTDTARRIAPLGRLTAGL